LAPLLGTPDGAHVFGDPLLGSRPVELASPERIARTLGDEVADALKIAPIGMWVGPVASPYGRHWLHVIERVAGEVPPLDAIEAEVALDWRREVGERAARERVERLVASWDVSLVRRSEEHTS